MNFHGLVDVDISCSSSSYVLHLLDETPRCSTSAGDSRSCFRGLGKNIMRELQTATDLLWWYKKWRLTDISR
jgi:hypothetical protein